VTTPPHRRDIQEGAADLIEELGRIYGYDRLPATLLADQLPSQHNNWPLLLEEQVRDILVGAGLQEVITYSLTKPEREEPLRPHPSEYIRIQNPISTELVVMRQTVLGGVLKVAADNLRYTEEVRFFEVGPVFLPRSGANLPDEPRRLAIVMCGHRRSEFWTDSSEGQAPGLDFYDCKAVIEALVADLHLPEVSYRPSKAGYLHPGKAAEFLVDGKPVGSFGQLHPKAASANKDYQEYKLGERGVFVAELDLEAILAAVPERYTYKHVPDFPAALRDIAVIVPEGITCERLLAEIRTAGGDLLRGIRLFDLYRGSSIPPGTKSLAFALTYRADDRTLTDKEVDKAHKKIEDRLKQVLKAQIRGQ
jgi:phenylalanyl-tRNA synthetase beta chain